jgi:hypothetical protein
MNEEVTRFYLLYIILPLWLFVGIADWLCHRRTRIESTSGPKESAIHLLMLAEVGTGVLAGLFLEINGLVILLMLLAVIAHEFTSHWDLRFALPRREVTAMEQHIHNYLGAVPFMAFSFVVVLHWPQALSLLGLGTQSPEFSIAWKSTSLPISYIATLLASITIFEVLPYMEELTRGLRVRVGPLTDLKAKRHLS